MCRQWELTGICDRPQGCKFAHTWEEYFKTKPQDVHYDPSAEFQTTPPFVLGNEVVSAGDDVVGRRLDTTTVCPVKRDLGWCPYGMKCRFLGSHLKRVEEGDNGKGKGAENERYGGWELTDHVEPEQKAGWKQGETNWQDHEVIRKLRFHSVRPIRRYVTWLMSKYEYKYSKEYLKRIEPHKEFYHDKNLKPAIEDVDEEEAFNDLAAGAQPVASDIPGESEADDVPLRPEEKRRLNWENGLYLAPLTTVGNLVCLSSSTPCLC